MPRWYLLSFCFQVLASSSCDSRKFSLHLVVPDVVCDSPKPSGKSLAYDVGYWLLCNAKCTVETTLASKPVDGLSDLDRFLLSSLQLHKAFHGGPGLLTTMMIVDVCPYNASLQVSSCVFMV